MAYNISSVLNSRMRMSGLSSGMDIDGIVSQLMKVEQMKVDRVKQSKTQLEWKRDDYRTVINSIRAFKDEFFEVTKPASNMRSASSFLAYKATYSGSASSDYLTATAGASAMAGTFSISSVQLAQYAKTTSSGAVTGSMVGAAINVDATTISAANNNNKIAVTFNGTTKEITLDDGLADISAVADNLNEKLVTAFGAGKISVTPDVVNNKLSFNTASTNILKIGSVAGNVGLEAIGFTSANKSNKLDLTSSLSSISGLFNTSSLTAADGDLDGYDIEFSINGEAFQFKSTQSLGEVINTVNGNSNAGVKMSYDQLNDKILVQSKTVGVTSAVKIDDVSGNGNLMSVLGLSGANITGTDASITYNDGSGDQTITRSSNEFTINGIAFNLKKDYSNTIGAPIEVKIEAEPAKALELVKSFVSKYNELIEKINGELGEKVYGDFPPLTDEQRESMEEADIKKWEDKAKSGMLRNDGLLRGFVGKMRDMLYKEVNGVSQKLYSIGITTGTWEQKGKLIIDETKLNAALTNSPQDVINLFTKESTTAYSPDMSAEDRATRDSENGIANRLLDVMQDYIRPNRNNAGKKGTLLEKAGIVGDITENGSLLSKEIQSKELIISTLLDRLVDKENSYYAKFTAMETALNKMNSQSSWLSQQFGS